MLIDAVLEGVFELVPDTLGVFVAVLDPVFVTVGVSVGVIGGETLLVAVCEGDQEAVPVPEALIVGVPDPVPDLDPDPVPVPEPLFVIVELGLAPTDPVLEGVGSELGV
jgi:hypothetical protein